MEKVGFMSRLSKDEKSKLMKEAISLLDRAEQLLNQCYLAHCKVAGIKQ